MYITLETDYAVRIVSALCIDGGRMDAKRISESTGVTLRFALKILHKLVAAGVVRSYKGPQGGYTLGAEPADITLRDVVEAVEGTYYFSRCLADGFECSHRADGLCHWQQVYGEISEHMREKLQSYTFADIAAHRADLREMKL